MDATSPWIQVAQTLGVSVACLMALAWAVWKSLRWLGERVIQPLAERHIKFLDDITENLKSLVRDNHAALQSVAQIAERVDEVAKKVSTVADQLHDVHSVIVRADNVTITPKATNATDPGRG